MPPIIDTQETLKLIHKAIDLASKEPDPDKACRLTNAANTAVSVVVLYLRLPRPSVKKEYFEAVKKLERELDTC